MAQPDLVGIVTRDMALSLKFYRLLGLDVPLGAESEDHVEFVTAGGFRIAWDSEKMIKGIYSDWVEPVGQRMTLAFKCANAAEVDTLYARLIQNGYKGHKTLWYAFWGQRYAVVVDSDCNFVDIFA